MGKHQAHLPSAAGRRDVEDEEFEVYEATYVSRALHVLVPTR